MTTIKGFITVNSRVNNAANVVSPFGELSPKSMSYSSDRGEYTSASLPDVRLTVFSTNNDAGDHVTVAPNFFNHALEIGDWIREVSSNGTINTNVDSLIAAVRADHPEIADSFIVDAIISDEDSYIPTYIKWTYASITFKLWFVNTAFESQYDDYEIKVIAPIVNLNDLHRPYSEIHSLLITDVTQLIGDANVIGNSSPYTTLKDINLTWVDKTTKLEVMTKWMVVIYGAAGNNPDSIAKAMVQHILDNSDFTAVEWYEVLPKLFKPTEFVIAPAWHRYSIVDESDTAGIHSPTVKHREVMDIINPAVVEYDAVHVANNVTYTTSVYKSLGLICVGNEGNGDGIFSLDLKFPDYSVITNTDIDFNRISPTTQGWMTLLHRMLIIAESMNAYTPLEVGYSRLKRNGVTYLVSTYMGVNYLVVTKESFMGYYNVDDTIA